MASSSLKEDVKKNLMNLQTNEDKIFANKEDEEATWRLYYEQGQIFQKLGTRIQNIDVKFTFEMASLECFSHHTRLSVYAARTFMHLGSWIKSIPFYKKSIKKAREYLAQDKPVPASEEEQQMAVVLEGIIKLAEFKIAESKACGTKDAASKITASETSANKDAESKIAASETSSVQRGEPKVSGSKKSPNPVTDERRGLRSYWVGLDAKIKTDFLKVRIAELKRFVKQGNLNKQFLFLGKEGVDALEEVLSSARKDKKWTFWMCRTLCAKKFSSADEFKSHLEQEHGADFRPTEQEKVQRIGKDWARKISTGGWAPVDAKAAVEMIENQLGYVKAFASKSKNGWSPEWPLAVDEERSKLLQEIKLLLVSLSGLKILPCSIREWVMRFPVQHLQKLQVSEQIIYDLRIKETPQSICFLECLELRQIRDFLKNVQCERYDGRDLVCRAVDYYLGYLQVKEKIDFDSQFSYLLLDKRLLKINKATFNDEGKIDFPDPDVYYAKAPAQGDGIISWLADYSSVDKMFPRTIRENNLDMWLAVMRAVQFTCRTLGTKYAKKMKVLEYETALNDVEQLCISEDGRRRNLQGDQLNRYASLLCDKCKEIVHENSLSTKLFLCAVRDVLEGTSRPRFDFPKNCMNLIRERTSLSDDIVLNSIRLLKSAITHKVLLIDSKILLIDNSRISLLDKLIGVSVFDNRFYMLRLLKPFLLNKIVNMESKVKSDAAKAELLHEEEKKASQALKKKSKRHKKTSMSVSSPLDQTVECEPSGNLVPKDTLASERGQLEISSNTDIQEEATEVVHDMLNMPGEVSLSEQMESAPEGTAAIYSSALDMTLKALLNINLLKGDIKNNKQPSHDDRGEQITRALQEVCTAFKSEVIEGVYSFLLSDLLASLNKKSRDAAEVLVTILEFWPCWKDPETESLVTRLFMLVENEKMSCRKCRREQNYSEQISFRIVMAADSVRDLKCAFGNMKFVDILKLVRMENKMLCDIKKGGCGETNFVRHVISRCPPVFTIVLEWEKSEDAKEICETTKALEWEIDISRLYEGIKPDTNYRLVSMVGCGEEDEHFCIAYGNNRWFSVMRDSLAEEDVGNWESLIKFCEERKIRPEILFYEGV